MLIAYLDEFGHIGPYLGDGHPKYGQHPVFGYAGYILPAAEARWMSADFNRAKTSLFKSLISTSSTPNQWERKGSEFFSTGSMTTYPQYTRAFNGLLAALFRRGGALFYYGIEKERGTPKQTGQDAAELVRLCLRESINRICTYAESQNTDVMILMDAITDKTRKEVVATMYGHIFSRTQAHRELQRIVEAPLHIESKLNAGIQFADWLCGLVSRASHFRIVPNSEFHWASKRFSAALGHHFTHESKIRTLSKAAAIYKSGLFLQKPATIRRISPNSLGARFPELRSLGSDAPHRGGFRHTDEKES